jgi:hypothetical protein
MTEEFSDAAGRPDQADLAKRDTPPLWPFSFEVHPPDIDGWKYVLVGNLSFGWRKAQFIVERFGLARTKRLLSEPLTETGWQQIWGQMVREYPDLASAVARKVQPQSLRRERYLARLELEPQMREELEAQSVVSSVDDCVLLGGYGYDPDFEAGTSCTLYFTQWGVWAAVTGSHVPCFRRSYSDSRLLDFTGPGKVTSGGGFIGGGFGLKGAAEGMVVASVLNSLTTRATVQTMIQYQAQDLEAFFFHSVETPQQLRIRLSGILGRIRSSDGGAYGTGAPDKLSELERLGKLYKDGVLTNEEFTAMKRKVIEGR